MTRATRRRVAAATTYALLLACAFVFVFPLAWIAGLSLKDRLQTFAKPPLFVWTPTFENYARVLGQADFLLALANSVAVSAGAVLLSLMVGVPAAYAFARFPFRGRSFLFLSLLVVRMLPPVAVLVPMYVLLSKAGLVNTRLSVILAYTTFSLPLVVWIMRGYFEDLPRELEESAWVDGASRYEAFRKAIMHFANTPTSLSRLRFRPGACQRSPWLGEELLHRRLGRRYEVCSARIMPIPP